jgi:hypothetical protein
MTMIFRAADMSEPQSGGQHFSDMIDGGRPTAVSGRKQERAHFLCLSLDGLTLMLRMTDLGTHDVPSYLFS